MVFFHSQDCIVGKRPYLPGDLVETLRIVVKLDFRHEKRKNKRNIKAVKILTFRSPDAILYASSVTQPTAWNESNKICKTEVFLCCAHKRKQSKETKQKSNSNCVGIV